MKFKDGKNTKKLFMCEREYLKKENFIFEKYDDSFIKIFYIEQRIKETLQYAENFIKKKLVDGSNDDFKLNLNKNIGTLYDELIVPNIYFILMIILSSIENGDEIKITHDIDMPKIPLKILYPIIWSNPYGKNREKYEKDLKKIYSKKEREDLKLSNLFNKIKLKEIIDSNISGFLGPMPEICLISNEKENPEKFEIIENISSEQNKINKFSNNTQNQKFGEEYYFNFLNLFNIYSNDFKEDIELSIYNNLNKGNPNYEKNLSTIKDMINEIIDDEESRNGFLALLRQSYLLGKLRNNIVSEYHILFFLFYRKTNLL